MQVINLSRSGATFKDVRTEQLPRLAALQPDVVTVAVAVAGNDMLHPATGTFHDHVASLLRQLPPGR